MAGEPEHGNDAGGTVGRGIGDDKSGDQAVWNDLVARLELPPYIDPATAPWPARENLSTSQAGHPTPADAAATADQAALRASQDRPDSPGSGTGSGGGPTETRSSQGTGTDRSRVIRPAGYLPFPADPMAAVPPDPATDSLPPDGRLTPDDLSSVGDVNYAANLADAADVDDASYLADDGYLSYDDEYPDDRYIPPPVPPLPSLDPVARGAWTALFGGPGYLFVATMASWQVPGWAELAAIIAFVSGFAILVYRLGDGPSRRDGPDQGAVV
jgi:hypothetical protein